MYSFSKIGKETKLSNLASGIIYISFLKELVLLKNKFFRGARMVYTRIFKNYSYVIEWLKQRKKILEEKEKQQKLKLEQKFKKQSIMDMEDDY